MTPSSYNDFELTLASLEESGNLRSIPAESPAGVIDLSTNDYLGLATRANLIEQFYATASPADLAPTAAASRLLAAVQNPYARLEQLLSKLYSGRHALLFNSGWHANTGIVPAIASKSTLILADRLVHASIIDGMKLSGADFARFKHNDFDDLERRIASNCTRFTHILVIVESVYSMDGDTADINRLIDIKRHYPNVMLYVDEAHAFGVRGKNGLGEVASSIAPHEVDIVVGTLGKAAASSGAFAITNATLGAYLVNRSRSFIFSTAIAPVNVSWSRFAIEHIVDMDAERQRLADMSRAVAKAIGATQVSHILPLIIGDSHRTVALSQRLLNEYSVKVLPIRTPTVPPGTERLRISLSAALSDVDINKSVAALTSVKQPIEESTTEGQQ